MKFDSKEDIKKFIDDLISNNELDDRDHLARILGISSSTLYGYIYRLEMPDKVYKKMQGVSEDITKAESTTNQVFDLSSISLDDLVAEIEKRGWSIDLSRSKNT